MRVPTRLILRSCLSSQINLSTECMGANGAWKGRARVNGGRQHFRNRRLCGLLRGSGKQLSRYLPTLD